MDVRFLGQYVQHILGHTIADMEEGILARADIDKSGLHAGQDILHLSFVDIAHQMRMCGPLQLHQLQLSLCLNRQPRLLGHGIDVNLLHARPSSRLPAVSPLPNQ